MRHSRFTARAAVKLRAVPSLEGAWDVERTGGMLPPLLGGFVIIALVATLVRFSPRFRAYDAENPVP